MIKQLNTVRKIDINLIETLDTTVNELEDILVDYAVNLPKDTKIQQTIEDTRFPPFAYDFYDLVIERGIIPTQSQFFEYYLKTHAEETVKIKSEIKKIEDLSSLEKDSLKCRIYKRSYPSLVRDLHFAFMVKENTLFEAYINPQMDVEEGIDLLIDDRFAVHLWLVTRASMKYRKRKYMYRHDYDDQGYVNIEMPLDPFNMFGPDRHNGKKLGDFFLFSVKEVNEMSEKILKKYEKFKTA